jgi:hypothetical protein
MRTIDFGTVLMDAVNLCGYDLSNITQSNFRTLRHFASTRLRLAWESYPWASLTRYVKLPVVITNDERRVTVPADAGEIVGVYSKNPLETTQTVYLSYALTSNGTQDYIVVLNGLTEVWVEYRIKREDLFGDLYDPSISYAAGSQIYFDAGAPATQSYMPVAGRPYRANFYKAKVNVPVGVVPVESNDANWELIKVPYIFGSYMSRGAYSDFLKAEQQFDDASRAESDAAGVLEAEYDKELRQQGQLRRINFISNY